MMAALPESARAMDILVTALPEASRESLSGTLLARFAWDHLRLALGGEEPILETIGPEARAEREKAARARRELERDLSEAEVERILARLEDAPLLNVSERAKFQRRTPEQEVRESILKECAKKRRIMPLRTFVRRFAEGGLLEVLPVWMLSPETMAILFPREPLFDLVIVDEASQCTVEARLPALMRAARFVVVGDEKQMPPSDYFRQGSDESEDTVDDEARDQRHMLTAESLLTLSRATCRHEGLKWHYRCQHESLIAFSNHAMYDASLLTVPATATAETAKALRWVSVEGASYEEGANPLEAERVVDVLDELLVREDAPSVGVVSFNLKQRRTILDAIDARVASDAAFQKRWEAAMANVSVDERPFIKNLESVQGDERDVIVFSLGHAPVRRRRRGREFDELYVPARFGPLGKRGGERRLNVAISRAKRECVIVSSFDPHQLNMGASKHEGPKLFKDYLHFASHTSGGEHDLATAVLARVRPSGVERARRGGSKLPCAEYVPLSVQIGLALEAHGHRVSQDVGSSGFRVPLAVEHPEQPGRFALAVLTDEGRDEQSVFETTVHYPTVLGMRGWTLAQITAADWLADREAVLEELLRALPSPRATAHRPAEASPAAAAEDVAEASDLAVAIARLGEAEVLNYADLVDLLGSERRARAFARRAPELLRGFGDALRLEGEAETFEARLERPSRDSVRCTAPPRA